MRKVYSCKDDFDPTSTTVSNAIKKILSDYSREVKVKVPTEEALSYVLFSDVHFFGLRITSNQNITFLS